jgi:hypothetical protein
MSHRRSVSFVASTRPEDNILNCDEELGTVLLKLQEIIVAHVVEDYVYRAPKTGGFKFRTQPVSQSASDSQATLRAHEPNMAQGLQTSMLGGQALKRWRETPQEQEKKSATSTTTARHRQTS